MKFLIRADASLQIGSGHVMRCLTLAQALREGGHEVCFATRNYVGNLYDFILKQGFAATLLPAPSGEIVSGSLKHSAWLGVSQAQDFADCEELIRRFAPDWLVCDHYALDAEWESRARAVSSAKVLAIDDLHDRAHAADILLDQNLGHRAADYAGLLPESCRVLTGTRYALLRPEFARWRERSLARRKASGSLKTILVNLGGVDKDNHTLRILQVLSECLLPQVEVLVVMGASAPHCDSVRRFAEIAPYPCRVITAANNMAELLAQSDWAVGAAGSSAWERCCLGVPTALLVLADNQQTIAQALHQAGAADILPIDFTKNHLQELFADTAKRSEQSHAAAALCDGAGVVRVVQHLLQPLPVHAALRDVCADDAARLYAWRNHADVRRFMLNTDEIAWENHLTWLNKQLNNPDFKMKIFTLNGEAQGFAGFSRREQQIWEWGFYLAPDCPRGQGRAFAAAMLHYAFAELGASTVRGRVLPHNAPSLALHQKMGFHTLPYSDGEAQLFELSANKFIY
ncbi:UDP-2,4-diacetamido-2,4,6-trideoxy-beta-L-altropyranose hydrolase [Conchiformibius steedae]|uniref:UDP-2,4-diacetamido-2,4, 6-trideoxy-beta-L-altropyranose hydrolase n=1 Tax=Conchiformibius steedae TaxID=153493 RepID=A0A3P2A945_9NEIS|nr:UDP-2,4-diacetamido-2,4,6-trideoxy-beta-L-altropyranose hydrolase [Conchiformibius steedae]RRD91316.1 UDP-2,4-diacetamido-2,4,6-trideoxy-beta-L-altropyranose hydrolase [Conchiformibius steedae]